MAKSLTLSGKVLCQFQRLVKSTLFYSDCNVPFF